MPHLLICNVIALYSIDSKDGCAVRHRMPAGNKVLAFLVASDIQSCQTSVPHKPAKHMSVRKVGGKAHEAL